MRVTVLGAGSWGTTVAALMCRSDHDVLLWARNPDVAAEVDEQRSNAAYRTAARDSGPRAGRPSRRTSGGGRADRRVPGDPRAGPPAPGAVDPGREPQQ